MAALYHHRHTSEIFLVPNQLRVALEKLISKIPNFKKYFSNFDVGRPLRAPYLFWYYYRDSGIDSMIQSKHAGLLTLVTDWIEEHYGEEYSRANDLLSRGYISYNTMEYLIRPGEVVISIDKGYVEAYRLLSCQEQQHDSSPISLAYLPHAQAVDASEYKWLAKVWSYGYLSIFYRQEEYRELKLSVRTQEEEVKIEELRIIPLRFAREELRAQLEKRGRIF